jgi:hypothetical protein
MITDANPIPLRWARQNRVVLAVRHHHTKKWPRLVVTASAKERYVCQVSQSLQWITPTGAHIQGTAPDLAAVERLLCWCCP